MAIDTAVRYALSLARLYIPFISTNPFDLSFREIGLLRVIESISVSVYMSFNIASLLRA